MKKTFLAIIVVLLAACSSTLDSAEQKTTLIRDEVEYANMQNMIELQNLSNRDVVFCLKSDTQTAEECAELFEKEGFVRTKEIPYKTAKFDILQKDTYPTRRWREGEKTPRW